jgi:hypothetical protein
MAEKVTIDTPDTLFPFMPPIWELVGWLDDKCTGMHTLLHRIQEDDSLKLARVHRQTLKKSCHEGASPRIAKKIEGNLHQVVEQKKVAELLQRITPTEPLVRGTNGTKWLMFFHGYLEGIYQHQPIKKLELPLTLSFLVRRAKAESDLILACHKIRKMEASPEEKLSRMRVAICEAFRHHTLLNSQEIQRYSAAMIDVSQPGQPRMTEVVAEVLKCSFCLRMDFYHQLLASFMVDMMGIQESLNMPDTLKDALVNHGGMGQLMPKLEEGKLITPTFRLYEYWCGAFSPPESLLSYRSMAKHLPRTQGVWAQDNEEMNEQDIQTIVDETRLTRLKEWRSGTVPNTDQLTTFLESITGESYGAFLPLVMTRVATAWTKWIVKEQTQLDQLVQETPALGEHLDFEWFLARFSRYPEYWAQAKA